MKILFILPEFAPDLGGIATYYNQYCSILDEKSIEYKILVGQIKTNKSKKDEIQYLEKNLYDKYSLRFAKLDLLPELKEYFAKSWALYEQAEFGNDFTLIETTDWGYGYVPWVLNKRKPTIVRLHGSNAQIEKYNPRLEFRFWEGILRILESSTLPMADMCLTHSVNNQIFWKTSSGLETVYIPPVIKRLSIESQIDDSIPKTPYLLVVGRIQNLKGPEVLCQALEKTLCPHPVYWIGRDTDFQKKGQSYNQYLSQKYPGIWGRRIIPVGPKPHNVVLRWMQHARFGIVPSTWDMLNLTAIEWLLLGKPVICSKGAGAWELIDAAKGGDVFESGAADQLAEIIYVWSNKSEEELRKMGAIANEHIRNILDPDVILQQNLALYKSLMEKGPKPAQTHLEWTHGLWMPDDEPSSREATMLQWPLREIMKHVWQRILGKITG